LSFSIEDHLMTLQPFDRDLSHPLITIASLLEPVMTSSQSFQDSSDSEMKFDPLISDFRSPERYNYRKRCFSFVLRFFFFLGIFPAGAVVTLFTYPCRKQPQHPTFTAQSPLHGLGRIHSAFCNPLPRWRPARTAPLLLSGQTV